MALDEFTIAERAPGSAGLTDPPLPPVRFAVEQTIISQYANSPIINRLISDFLDYIDPAYKLEDFYNLIWNVDTAQGYGLDLWGRIVGVSRIVHLPVGGFFGFEEATDGNTFESGIFYGQGNLTSNFSLSDTVFRRVILAKALANICDGSIPAINQILINLFPGYGNCYVIDNLDMTMEYRFHGTLSAVDLALASQSGILPKPAGVSVTIVQGP